MSLSRLTLVSHAPTEAQQHAAFPLDEPVLEQEIAKAATLKWRTPGAQIWSAPERRARETASALGLMAADANELRECDYGRWRGRLMDAVQSEDLEGIHAWLTDPSAAPHGGESLESLIARVGAWMEEQRAARHTIAITHVSVIRAAIVYGLHLPAQTFWRFDIAALTKTELHFNRDVWTLKSANCPLRTAGHAVEAETGI